jgi:hypothetical protein
MRKLLVAIWAVGLLATSAAHASHEEFNRGECVDITGANLVYLGTTNPDGTTTTGRVTGSATLELPACQGVMYTVNVLDEATSTDALASDVATVVSANPTTVTFATATFTASDSDVCIYVTSTAGAGPHLFDRAPDTGCIPHLINTGGGETGFD